MEPSSFKFDEEDCRRGGGVSEEGEQQLDNFSYENDTFDDDDDHYFRMPSSTTAVNNPFNLSDVNSNNIAQGRGTSSTYDNVIDNDATQKNESVITNDAPTSKSADNNTAPTTSTANTVSSSQLPPRSSNSGMNAPPPPPPPPTQPPPRRPTRTNNRSASRNYTQQSTRQQQSNNQRVDQTTTNNTNSNNNNNNNNKPTLEPYIARLEKFELFSTLQCYYLVACDKHSTGYRIMKMDRTLIEKSLNSSVTGNGVGGNGGVGSGEGSSVRDNISKNNASSRGEGNLTGIEARNSLREINKKQQQEQQQFAEIPLERQSVHLNANSFDNTATDKDDDASTTMDNTNAASFDQLDKDKTLDDDKSTTTNSPSSPSKNSTNTNTASNPQQNQSQTQQNNQSTTSNFRQLSDFIFEDPAIYTQSEIRDILDMINDGNKKFQGSTSGGNNGGSGGSSRDVPLSSTDSKEYDNDRTTGGGVGGSSHNSGSGSNSNGGTGLKPICKAYGILGFIKFLDCYYLTLITKRAKVGNIGGNSIYTIKVCFVCSCVGLLDTLWCVSHNFSCPFHLIFPTHSKRKHFH